MGEKRSAYGALMGTPEGEREQDPSKTWA